MNKCAGLKPTVNENIGVDDCKCYIPFSGHGGLTELPGLTALPGGHMTESR